MYVDVPNEMVLVETHLSSTVIQSLLEETGRLVVFRGFGGTGNNGKSEQLHNIATNFLSLSQSAVKHVLF